VGVFTRRNRTGSSLESKSIRLSGDAVTNHFRHHADVQKGTLSHHADRALVHHHRSPSGDGEAGGRADIQTYGPGVPACIVGWQALI